MVAKRTTLNIRKGLYDLAQERAAQLDTTLSQYIKDCVRAEIEIVEKKLGICVPKVYHDQNKRLYDEQFTVAEREEWDKTVQVKPTYDEETLAHIKAIAKQKGVTLVKFIEYAIYREPIVTQDIERVRRMISESAQAYLANQQHD